MCRDNHAEVWHWYGGEWPPCPVCEARLDIKLLRGFLKDISKATKLKDIRELATAALAQTAEVQ